MSRTSHDIGIRLKPEEKHLKAELEKMAAELGPSLERLSDPCPKASAP